MARRSRLFRSLQPLLIMALRPPLHRLMARQWHDDQEACREVQTCTLLPFLIFPSDSTHREAAAGRRRKVKPVLACTSTRRRSSIIRRQRARTGLSWRSRAAGLCLGQGRRDDQTHLSHYGPGTCSSRIISEPRPPPEAKALAVEGCDRAAQDAGVPCQRLRMHRDRAYTGNRMGWGTLTPGREARCLATLMRVRVPSGTL